MSLENQKKIKEVEVARKMEEEKANNKAKVIKDLLSENKKKKKVTCRADTVKARELPARVRGRGRGRRRGRGRGRRRGRGSIETPKL